MEPRISLITLGVTDLQRSLRFYRVGLGLPTTWDGEKGVVFFKTQGVRLGLYPLDDLAKDVGGEFVGSTMPKFSGTTLAHNVKEKTEVDAVLVRAEKAGAKIEKPGQDTFWGGYAGYFSDPDGHLWEIAWGAFPFLDDGSLDIP